METDLTPLEKWTALYDTDERQLFFFLVLDYKGAVDRGRLQEAMGRALEGRAWFKSCIGTDGRWTSREVGAESPFSSAGGIRAFIDERVDLHKAPLFKVMVTDGQMLFKFHHVLTDARGAAGLVHRVIGEYNGHAGALSGEQAGQSPASASGSAAHAAKSSANWLRNIVHRSDEIHCLEGRGTGRAAYLSLTIKEADTASLEGFAGRHAFTVNDVLTGLLFATVRDWNGRWGKGFGRIRFSVPISFKSMESPRNQFDVVSLALDGVAPDAGAVEVIRKVSEAMSIRKKGRGKNTIFRLLTVLPGYAGRKLIESKFFSTTTAFSNLGVFSGSRHMLGGAEITGVRFFMGAHPSSSAYFASVGYGGRISLGISYDDRRWDREMLLEFAGMFGRNLDGILGGGSEGLETSFL